MNTSAPRWHHGLLLGLSLGMVLLLLSHVRTGIDATQSMMLRNQMFAVMLDGPMWGTTLGNNLLFFGFALLLIHLLFGTAGWMLGHLSARAWPSATTTLRQHVMLWTVLLTVGLLANNAASFPTSSLGESYSDAMTLNILGATLGQVIWSSVLVAAAATAAMASWRWWRAGNRPAGKSYLALGAMGIAYVALSAHSILPAPAPSPSSQPNVILIGFDSLRADMVDPQLSPGAMPHLAAFMKSGTRFTNAMTPLARTFPAMCAMLTGQRPHHSGAFMNLLPRNLIDDSESMPRMLTQAGYHTTYATDETRFANIDESFGFAQTITPPMGASDFLIARISDAPLTNLVLNTRIGGWLFPHLYANRGAAATYDPDSFVARIDRELTAQRPLFLTVHLTLAHWPYYWAGTPAAKKDDRPRWPQYYLDVSRRVDQQFADILESLDQRRLLENAVVIVYSDHGESFASRHEALTPDGDPLIVALQLSPNWGHGTSVLTEHQFRIVLGMHRYGGNWPSGRELASPVSFEDIAPTVLEALGKKAPARFDGRSLLPLLEARKGAEQSFLGRIRFTETEYNPEGLATQEGEVSTSKVQETLSLYHIDRKTDRLSVKPKYLGKLLGGRQFAAVGPQYIVGAFPSKSGDRKGSDILAIPLAGGEPRRLMTEPQADEPELQALWTALHSEFGRFLYDREPRDTYSAVADRERTVPRSVTK